MHDVTMMVGAMAMVPAPEGHNNMGVASGKVLAAATRLAPRARWTDYLEGRLSARKGCKKKEETRSRLVLFKVGHSPQKTR